MQAGNTQRIFNKLSLGLVVLFFITLALVGCGGGGGSSTPAKTLTSIAITPTTVSIASGLSAPFSATATYSDASTADITSQVVWSSANTGVATVNSSTGIATGVAIGSTTVTAALGSISSPAADLTITSAVLTGINISATANSGTASSIIAISIAKGLPVNFSAVGTYSDNNIVNITSAVTWVSSNAGVSTLNSSGIASSLAQGSAGITATLAGVTSNAMTLTVTAPALTSIAITPTTATVAQGITSNFTATGSYTDSTTANITNQVNWTSSNVGVATINSTTGATSGIATGVAVGSSSITASLNGITSTAANLTVTAAVVTAISVTPTTSSIAKGLPTTFTATASYSDGSSGNVSGSVIWASSNTVVATLSASGIASSLAQGSTTVSASSNGVVSNGATLTVTPATLTAIAITPNAASVVKRSTLGFSATGTYTDATTANISNQVAWSSSDLAVASITNAGVASGLTTGSVVISASASTINSNAVALVVTVAGIQQGGAREGVVPSLAGSVTTLAGSGVAGNVNGTGSSVGFNTPRGITTDGLNLYISDTANGVIRKINLNTGVVSTISTGISTTFQPSGITTDGTNLYVILNGSAIQKIVIATGVSTTLAGSVNGGIGCIDGMGGFARFGGGNGFGFSSVNSGITTDGTNLYVADTRCDAIRKVVIANGAVSTIAGTYTTTLPIKGVVGNTDNAVGTKATFNLPKGITTDGVNLYVADTGNNNIRVVNIATTAVTTLAGSALINGGADGVGTAAGFNQPAGITTDGTYLYVADTMDHTIRKIEIATGTVTTIAGLALTSGNADGSGVLARFNSPSAIVTDGLSLYVTDTNNHTVREVR
jgi:sugar lactone lactonase YvrE